MKIITFTQHNHAALNIHDVENQRLRVICERKAAETLTCGSNPIRVSQKSIKYADFLIKGFGLRVAFNVSWFIDIIEEVSNMKSIIWAYACLIFIVRWVRVQRHWGLSTQTWRSLMEDIIRDFDIETFCSFWIVSYFSAVKPVCFIMALSTGLPETTYAFNPGWQFQLWTSCRIRIREPASFSSFTLCWGSRLNMRRQRKPNN